MLPVHFVEIAGHIRGSERRAHERVPLDAPVRVLADDDTTLDGRGNDLSLGGINLQAAALLADGTTVEVVVELPGGDRIDALAQVVRADGRVVALRFLELNPCSLHAIVRHVATTKRTVVH